MYMRIHPLLPASRTVQLRLFVTYNMHTCSGLCDRRPSSERTLIRCSMNVKISMPPRRRFRALLSQQYRTRLCMFFPQYEEKTRAFAENVGSRGNVFGGANGSGGPYCLLFACGAVCDSHLQFMISFCLCIICVRVRHCLR